MRALCVVSGTRVEAPCFAFALALLTALLAWPPDASAQSKGECSHYALVRFTVSANGGPVGAISNEELLDWAVKNRFYSFELVENEPTVRAFLRSRLGSDTHVSAPALLDFNSLTLESPLADWRNSQQVQSITQANRPIAIAFASTGSAITHTTGTPVTIAAQATFQAAEISGDKKSQKLPGQAPVARGPGEFEAPQALAVPFGAIRTPAVGAAERDVDLITYRRFCVLDNAGEIDALLQLLPRRAKSAALDSEATLFITDSMARLGTVTRFVQMPLSPTEIRSLQAVRENVDLQVIRGRMQVRLSSGSNSIQPKPLSDSDSRLLNIAFGDQQLKETHRPVLIILDDVWPTRAAFRQSVRFLETFVKTAWPHRELLARGLEDPLRTFISLAAVEDPGPPRGYNCKVLDDCPTHARRVLSAIEPYIEAARLANKESPVDVVFIPLTRAQKGADEFLRILYTTGYALGSPDRRLPNITNLGDPRKLAEMVRNRDEFLDLVSKSLSPNELSFATSEGILSTVVQIAERFTEQTSKRVFINASWSTTSEIKLQPLKEIQIFAVAAAGRCPRPPCKSYADEVEPHRFFAKRAESRDFLLVMQLDSADRPTCGSYRIRKWAHTVGFDGDIIGDCGTSYAAPRVAWLLAAREAIRPTHMRPGEHWVHALGEAGIAKPTRANSCHGEEDFSCVALRMAGLLSETSAVDH